MFPCLAGQVGEKTFQWNMYSLQTKNQAVALQENHFVAGKETTAYVLYIYIFNLWIDVTFWVHKGGGNNP